MAELKLRDALDELVPDWPELQRKTSLEAVVTLAVATAHVSKVKSDTEHALLAWAKDRFGDEDAVKGAARHMIESDLAREIRPEFLEALRASIEDCSKQACDAEDSGT